MNKLSKEVADRATKTLKKCAEATKDIKDKDKLNDEVYRFLKEADIPPELMGRACEGYNSAKSVCMLSEADDNNRGDSFSIVNPREITKRAQQEAAGECIKKAASANGFKKAQFVNNVSTSTMHKSASTQDTVRHEQAAPRMRKMSAVEIKMELNSCADDMANCLHKVAREHDYAVTAVHTATDEFISAMAKEKPEMRKNAAELLSNAFGAYGDMLVDTYNVAASKDNKITDYDKNRYEGSVRLPDTKLFKLAKAVFEAHANKCLADEVQNIFMHDAVDYARDVINAYKDANMRKQASLFGGMEALSGMVAANKITERLAPSESTKSDAELENEINTTALSNILKQHSVKRAFMNTITDSTIMRYPLHQVTQAFNEALSELPIHMRDMPPTAFSALLKSRTIARLARGNAASGSDVDQIEQMQTAYSRVKPDDVLSYGKEFK